MEKTEVLNQIIDKFNEVKTMLKTADSSLLNDPEVLQIRQSLKQNMTFIQTEMNANKTQTKDNNPDKKSVDPSKEIKALSDALSKITKAMEGATKEATYDKIQKQFNILEKKFGLLKKWLNKHKATIENIDTYLYEMDKLEISMEETKVFFEDRKESDMVEKVSTEVVKTKPVEFYWKVHERKGMKDIAKVQKKIKNVKLGKNKKDTIADLQAQIEAMQDDISKENEVAKLTIIFYLELIQSTKGDKVTKYWQIASVKVSNDGGKGAGEIYLSSKGASPKNTTGNSSISIPLKMERAEDTGFHFDIKKAPDMLDPSDDPLHDHTVIQVPESYQLDPLKVFDLFSEKKIEAKSRELSLTVSISTDEGQTEVEVKGDDDNFYKEFSYKEKLFSKKLFYWGELRQGAADLKKAIEAIVQ